MFKNNIAAQAKSSHSESTVRIKLTVDDRKGRTHTLLSVRPDTARKLASAASTVADRINRIRHH